MIVYLCVDNERFIEEKMKLSYDEMQKRWDKTI